MLHEGIVRQAHRHPEAAAIVQVDSRVRAGNIKQALMWKHQAMIFHVPHRPFVRVAVMYTRPADGRPGSTYTQYGTNEAGEQSEITFFAIFTVEMLSRGRLIEGFRRAVAWSWVVSAQTSRIGWDRLKRADNADDWRKPNVHPFHKPKGGCMAR